MIFLENQKIDIDNTAEREWTDLSTPVYKDSKNEILSDDTQHKETEHEYAKQRISSPVITFQLITCLIILTFAFLVKTFWSYEFSCFKEHFNKELNASMFFDGKLTDLDYSDFFKSSDDEI